jgi:hypothetical protein
MTEKDRFATSGPQEHDSGELAHRQAAAEVLRQAAKDTAAALGPNQDEAERAIDEEDAEVDQGPARQPESQDELNSEGEDVEDEVVHEFDFAAAFGDTSGLPTELDHLGDPSTMTREKRLYHMVQYFSASEIAIDTAPTPEQEERATIALDTLRWMQPTDEEMEEAQREVEKRRKKGIIWYKAEKN